MMKFALIQTEVGQPDGTVCCFGPFEETTETDAFIAKVRNELMKVPNGRNSPPIAVHIIAKVPKGMTANDPGHFTGFMRIM